MSDTDPTIANSVLDQLVGPGKKFADDEALAKGKLAADAFVDKLTSENRDLRNIITAQDSRLAKMESRLSILDRLGNDSEEDDPDNRGGGVPNKTPDSEVTPPIGFSEADALKLIEKHDVGKQHAANRQLVDQVLNKQLGSEAAAFVKQRGSELGLSEQALVQLATTSPKAFLSMLGLSVEGSPSNSMYRGGSGSDALNNNRPATRNKTYYDKLKTEMGAKKFAFDRSTQIQMHKDMQALGDAFES